ncbi:MAG: phosphatase PAP2 family protein [Capnocytophaga sp.]|nr:phosphatase PAP2 family protein [Capnocytophaga sp.]
MIKFFIICLFYFYSTIVNAQIDSLFTDTITKKENSFHTKQLIAPMSLISLGILAKKTDFNHFVRKNTTNYVSGKIHIDDYIQYAPIASVFAMSNLGVKAKHSVKERMLIGATAYAITAVVVNGLKYSIRELRPDETTRNSFPSGHTATAFTGIEMFYQEYKDSDCLLASSGYIIASFVGIMRIRNNRHWASDVLAGAGIGILSAKTAYWLFPTTQKLFFGENSEKTSTKISLYPIYSEEMKGIGVVLLL